MVIGESRSPLPPAITMAMVFRVILAVAYMMFSPLGRLCNVKTFIAEDVDAENLEK
jgi:hypothetical protein